MKGLSISIVGIILLLASLCHAQDSTLVLNVDFVVSLSNNSTTMSIRNSELFKFWEKDFHGMPTLEDYEQSQLDRIANNYEVRKPYWDRYMSLMETSQQAMEGLSCYPDIKRMSQTPRGVVIRMPNNMYWQVKADVALVEIPIEGASTPTFTFTKQYSVFGWDNQGNSVYKGWVADLENALFHVGFQSATMIANKHLSLERQLEALK